MSELKKTILYEKHQSVGATIVEFGGFLMPLYYTTIPIEHHTIRNEVGMFDVSHMGEILIKGKDALKFANYILSSNIVVSNKMQYGFLLYENGTIVDDLMVYPFSEDKILLVVNASNTDKDFEHILKYTNGFDITVENRSNDFGEIAVQGPKSFDTLSKLFKSLPEHSGDFGSFPYEDGYLLISRSGYTGEDGFEIYGSNEEILNLWDKFYNLGITPCGLGCRDTLRFEAAMPLYGHEIDNTINPFEAGLTFAVDLTKEDFVGKAALTVLKDNIKRKVVGLELLERNVPRQGYPVFAGETEIGRITTGYLSPSTNLPIAMALIDSNYAKIGTNIYVSIRNKMIPAVVRNKKFIEKKNKV
ncbi:glycine cleavage system aminomethyltransferase GcvT [Acholeplasma equirhinis]|uniref:glycine cleavage system aminomethyltransferase GcvT n=1 Tax=Acholeplasma equirhinis TaxID=555393 RepID=UPI00197ADFCA|nr:glycine cleavage system aminomethyltransferase GcvT [Acholeplasma equirhinis]MBN3490625.1 glycine cleavage system aminomethyltransferase GcvT [Acholeplasma equirhinis]